MAHLHFLAIKPRTSALPPLKCRLARVVAFRRMILLKPNLPPTQTREATDRENSAIGDALSDSAISRISREPKTWTRAGTLRCNFDLSAIPREVWHYHWAEAGREKAARNESEQCSRALQKSTKLLYTRRFWQLLSVAAMKGITASVEG